MFSLLACFNAFFNSRTCWFYTFGPCRHVRACEICILQVTEATLVSLACRPSLIHRSMWRKVNQEPLESTACPASLVLEVKLPSFIFLRLFRSTIATRVISQGGRGRQPTSLKTETNDDVWHSYILSYVCPQATRVCQVFLVVRVFLELLVCLTKLKDSRECPGFLDDLARQAFPEPKVKLESPDSLARLDQG